MAFETIAREVEHRITGRPDFKDLVFTQSSPGYLTRPDAVKYAADRGAVLQSAREAAIFRMEANGADHADNYQVTRTGALYFVRQGIAYVAFDDSPDGNLVIALAQKGYDLNRSGKELLIPLKDADLRVALGRAEKGDRISQLPAQSHLELSLQSDGQSSFGSNQIVQGVLGDVSGEYASHLSGKGYRAGHLWTVPTNRVSEQVDNSKNVLLRPVGLGGGGFGGFYYVGAGGNFNYGGFARGVRAQAQNSP